MLQGREERFDLGIALLHALGQVVENRQRLLEQEQVLVAPVVGQRLGNVVLAGLDAAVVMSRQHERVALAGDDVANDGLAREAHDVAEHLGELDVHRKRPTAPSTRRCLNSLS
jgi:acetyl-CoA carboxylase carboxyltransferase component